MTLSDNSKYRNFEISKLKRTLGFFMPDQNVFSIFKKIFPELHPRFYLRKKYKTYRRISPGAAADAFSYPHFSAGRFGAKRPEFCLKNLFSFFAPQLSENSDRLLLPQLPGITSTASRLHQRSQTIQTRQNCLTTKLFTVRQLSDNSELSDN